MDIRLQGSGLSLAICLATLWHGSQLDKAGAPYICHPLRMMLRAIDRGMHPDVAMVAALHDTVEDTVAELADLRKIGLSEEIVSAVDALTRRPQEAYESHLVRLAGNTLARTVKLLDLEDNSDPDRLAKLEPRVRTRLSRKYAEAIDYLSTFERA